MNNHLGNSMWTGFKQRSNFEKQHYLKLVAKGSFLTSTENTEMARVVWQKNLDNS